MSDYDFNPAFDARRREYTQKTAAILSARYHGRAPLCFVHTYGCQGNVSDSERIKGMLREMGCRFTDKKEEADIVLFNTCAVRGHAEDRVFGNVGALKPIKDTRPDMLIILCGCMMQQQSVCDRIRRSYPYVNLLFGTHATPRLPELMYRMLSRGKRVFDISEEPASMEGLPVERDRGVKAWLPIMYGCNNFCSYCIVPYVRGRERSRSPEAVIKEAKQLIADGAKEITLLGQNVNSYGNGGEYGVNFSGLLKMLNDLDGDFKIRFMTSHPKDCTHELLDTMASCEKVSHHLHLPVQSGCNRVLGEMNRRYTRERYLELVDYAKKVMPDVSLTSDIIVGFPGESYEEFKETLSLIREVEYTSLFTFIYSPREGTRAAAMPDKISAEEKSRWFSELLQTQESIAAERTKKMQGKIYRVLVESETKQPGILSGRTDGNISIDFPGDSSLIDTYVDVKVCDVGNWTVRGELIK